MQEYNVHILNWPVYAESPEDAVRTLINDSEGLPPLWFTVTDKEARIAPAKEGKFEVLEIIDSDLFWEEDD